MHQTTLQNSIQCTGTGLHSGKDVCLTIRPAQANSGIQFHIETPSGIQTITPTPEAVSATSLATTLAASNVAVSTVEHLMAALLGLKIDNAHIDIQGQEIPIMDGSAAFFLKAIHDAGIVELNAPRKSLRIKRKTTVSDGEKYIVAEPYNGFYVDYTIKFNHPAIGVQRKCMEVTPESFSEVANARTFGFIKDVEMLKQHGMALGGSLENAIGLDEKCVLNKEGLRYKDEFVRHKILDFIGDMGMLGLPLQGKFTICCSGHGLNNQLLRHLTKNAENYLGETTPLSPKKNFLNKPASHTLGYSTPTIA